MKVKTYDSRTCVITIEESKIVVNVEEAGVTEIDFEVGDLEVKKYPLPLKAYKEKKEVISFLKRAAKWVVATAMSAIVGTYATGFFIG